MRALDRTGCEILHRRQSASSATAMILPTSCPFASRIPRSQNNLTLIGDEAREVQSSEQGQVGGRAMATADARRYRAFISYSHRDRVAGDKLFKRLDGYRPPKALRGYATRFGPVPAKLYPVFRDREELAASPDLTGRLQAALEASDHLVVVCSPHAAASRWVNHEVEAFRELGRADRIHAVVVDGEPMKAFPPALTQGRAMEPIAADLRKGGDGWNEGTLKVIAGLDFGQLKDRELARARVHAFLYSAIAGVFALLAVVAFGAIWLSQRGLTWHHAIAMMASAVGLYSFYIPENGRDPCGRVLEGISRRRPRGRESGISKTKSKYYELIPHGAL